MEIAPDLPTGATGRTIVVLDPRIEGTAALRALGIDAVHAGESSRGGTIVLDQLGVAIVEAAPELLFEAAADPSTPVLIAEPEVWVHAFGAPPSDPEEDPDDVAPGWFDTDLATWGLLATQVIAPLGRIAPWRGKGVRVAILDTGFDASHPDLAGRVANSRSFVEGESVQDGNGHGTHVAGTIGATERPVGGQRRYSVAPEVELIIGKVLSNAGSGTSGGVLEGMNWAIEQGAQVISMSLGSGVAPGQTYLRYYEVAAQAALAAGSLIIAAAGNDGWRPVGSPANCPSVLSVAALEPTLVRAEFSCVGLNGEGGEVNIAAPGVGTYSSWPVDQGSYAVLAGTSMATTHVSGIAALVAGATGLRGKALWDGLAEGVQALSEGPMLVGAGLATAPTETAEEGEPDVPQAEQS